MTKIWNLDAPPNKKYIFRNVYIKSDVTLHIIASRDLLQLNMKFEQCKRIVKVGSLPVTLEQAKELAAIQLQIDFNDYKEDKRELFE